MNGGEPSQAGRDDASTLARVVRHVARRLPQYVIVMGVVVTLNFLLPRLMPGDPIQLLLGENAARLPAEDVAAALERFGLDRPLHEQYVMYISDLLLRGDLGFSYRWRLPVTEVLLARLPWTLLLVGLSLLLSTIVGVLAGVLAAWRRGTRADSVALTGFLSLDAMPSFWVGLILLVVFVGQLQWFPSFGARTPGAGLGGIAWAGDVVSHLALPVTTLTLVTAGGMFLVVRYAMIGVIGEDYIITARAKGLSERSVALRHGLPNAALPVVTTFLLRAGFVVGGATVVETVFTYPGLGRLILQAALSRDYPVMQGAFLLLATTVVAANLLADVLYPFLDPRVRGDDR